MQNMRRMTPLFLSITNGKYSHETPRFIYPELDEQLPNMEQCDRTSLFESRKRTTNPPTQKHPSDSLLPPETYKSMSQSTQTIRIPIEFARFTWSTIPPQLRSKAREIHRQILRQERRRHRLIADRFIDLFRQIQRKQLLATQRHRRDRIIKRKLKKVHQHILTLQNDLQPL